MKISKNSWHFKLVRHFDRWEAHSIEQYGTSLCPYFWKVVGYLTLITALTSLALLVLTIYGFPLINMVFPDPEMLNTSILVWIVTLCFVTMCVVAYGLEQGYKKWKNRSRKAKVQKEPGLVRSFIQAKKDKFCPTIKVVE